MPRFTFLVSHFSGTLRTDSIVQAMKHLCFLLLLYLVMALSFPCCVNSLNADGFSLLALKAAVTVDPHRSLLSWNESDNSPCGWTGITCSSGRVSEVSLPNMGLTGYIPSEFGFLLSLRHLSLRQNNFSKSIPCRLFTPSSLLSLDLSYNAFSGPIPSEISHLRNLTYLDLSSNQLTGNLPDVLVSLTSLTGTLNLSQNKFNGQIPNSFGSFPVTLSLDLRNNNLSGPIPQLGSLLNQGPMAFTGNPFLCGFPLQKHCSNFQKTRTPQYLINSSDGTSSDRIVNSSSSERKSHKVQFLILVLSAVVFITAALLLSACVLWKKCEISNNKIVRDKNGNGVGIVKEDGHAGELHALDGGFNLDLEDLLRASAYMMGKSRSGIVYKVVTCKGATLAVRRLSEGGEGCMGKFKDFEAEVQSIARVRHQNIVPLRAFYFACNEKLLVSDYICNGSLYMALHCNSSDSSPALSWARRLNIALGTARGLAYIHDFGARKYMHGNFKSSKVLLDEQYNPYISGFGLGRLGFDAYRSSDPICRRQTSTRVIGSGGGYDMQPTSSGYYMAPETHNCGTRLTQKCDVYAFGIVLLELLTGRTPNSKVNCTGRELENFVRQAFKEECPLSEIVDPQLLNEFHAKKQVLATFQIALGCIEADPDRRPKMKAISGCLAQIGRHRDHD